MNIKQISLTLLVASTLVACGSSSNGSTPTKPAPINPAPVVNYNASKLITTKNGVIQSNEKFKSTSDINQLKVKGKMITLVPPTVHSGVFYKAMGGVTINGVKEANKIISGSNYTARFGLVENENNIVAFSQGKVTNDVPTTGQATYKGNYAGYDHTKKAYGTGELTATADFSSKKFSVLTKVDSKGVPSMNFTSDIKGNGFITASGETEAKGHFYGNKAKEVSGTYHNTEKKYTAAFGAKKN